MVEIEQYISNLKLVNGIYYNNSADDISYPSDGNDACFLVEDRSFWFKHRNEAITLLIEKYNFRQPVFDVGGGNGFSTLQLQKRNTDCVLIEPGNGVFNAKKRGVENILNARFQDLNISNKGLPSVLLLDVLEHIDNDVLFLQQMRSGMATDAKILVSVPAYQFLWSHDDIYAGHFRRYTAGQLRKVLRQAGFIPLMTSYLFSPLVAPLLITRTIASLFTPYSPEAITAKTRREHGYDSKVLTSMLSPILGLERKVIKNGFGVPFGTSVVCVAKTSTG